MMNPDHQLLAAVHDGDAHGIRTALADGAHAHVKANMALHDAVAFGHAEVVRLLLAAGAEVHAGDESIIGMAVVSGRRDIIKMLMAARAAVQGDGGEGALCYAAYHGQTEMLRTLLGSGVNVHAMDDIALRESSANGHAAVVQLLLDSGADARAKNDDALYFAAVNGHVEVVHALLVAGADPVGVWHRAQQNAHAGTVTAILDACGDTMTVAQRTALVAASQRFVILRAMHGVAIKNRRMRR